MNSHEKAREMIREVHPEVCFYGLAQQDWKVTGGRYRLCQKLTPKAYLWRWCIVNCNSRLWWRRRCVSPDPRELPQGDGVMFGAYQAIAVDGETGVYAGATEMRKDGVVVAY